MPSVGTHHRVAYNPADVAAAGPARSDAAGFPTHLGEPDRPTTVRAATLGNSLPGWLPGADRHGDYYDTKHETGLWYGLDSQTIELVLRGDPYYNTLPEYGGGEGGGGGGAAPPTTGQIWPRSWQ